MSRVRHLAIVGSVAIAACSSDSDAPPKPAPTTPTPADAAIDGITTIGTFDPASGAHLDEDPAPPTATRPLTRRAGRPIEILLRSSPSGATVSVDGFAIGVTPTYWLGETGAEHEFTFSLPRHALARYRFLPITTGTLHARLDPVASDVDAGVPPPGLVAPPPIAPPETLVSPAPKAPDAAVVAPPVMFDAPLPPSPPIDAAPATTPGFGPPQ